MGANASIRSIGTGSRWTLSTRSSTSTRQTAAWGSIPVSTRTRTSSLISPLGAIWPNSPRSEPTRCSISITPTSTGCGRAGTGLATRIQPIPNTSIASSRTATEAERAWICRSVRAAVPRSSPTNMTVMKSRPNRCTSPVRRPPRESAPTRLSTSRPAVPMASMRPALLEENSNDPEALDHHDLRRHVRAETHRQGGPGLESLGLRAAVHVRDRHRRAFRACPLLVAGTRVRRCHGPWFRSARRTCNLRQAPRRTFPHCFHSPDATPRVGAVVLVKAGMTCEGHGGHANETHHRSHSYYAFACCRLIRRPHVVDAPGRRYGCERARQNRLYMPDAPGLTQRPSRCLPDLRHAPQG